jgi:hypothetical protein
LTKRKFFDKKGFSMNRADQQVLYQQTNLGLLSIRQAELNYYVSLNTAFGTQAALIGGFTYGVFTQNQVNDDTSYSDYFQDIYWVTSAGTIAAAVHVIISTMAIQVLGPGLALHGPIGSMARATEGMRLEQKPVIASFIIMMILFTLSTILSFWAVMSFYSAIAGTIVYLIAARYWYYYSERIYLRFHWFDEESKFHLGDDDDTHSVPLPEEERVGDHKGHVNRNPIHDYHGKTVGDGDRATTIVSRNEGDISGIGEGGGGRVRPKTISDRKTTLSSLSEDDVNAVEEKKKKSTRFRKGFSFFSKQRKQPKQSKDSKSKSKESIRRGSVDSTLTSSLLPVSPDYHQSQVAMEGYLLKKTQHDSTLHRLTDASWERRYFILTFQGMMYYYKTRQEFRITPDTPINHRPIDLHDFYIEMYNSEMLIAGKRLSSEESMVVGSGHYNSSLDGSLKDGSNHNLTGLANLAAAAAASVMIVKDEKEEKKKNDDRRSLSTEEASTLHNPRTSLLRQSRVSVSGTYQPPMIDKILFQITLIPKESLKSSASSAASSSASDSDSVIRRNIVLRCDTEEELEIWISVIRDISPESFISDH